MRTNWIAAGAWVAFALIVATGAELMLSACDLGWRPVLGLSYCRVQAAADPLAAERAREIELRAKLHAAELRTASLPECALPPRREPSARPPEPRENPPPRAEAAPSPAPPEALTVPRTLADLKGCWQSVQGDLPMVSDDDEQSPLGNVRICYCFGDDGRGTVHYVFTDGGKCRASLKAHLSPDRLSFKHPRIACDRQHGYVIPAEVVCTTDPTDGGATCDKQNLGRVLREKSSDKFQRVSEEHCR